QRFCTGRPRTGVRFPPPPSSPTSVLAASPLARRRTGTGSPRPCVDSVRSGRARASRRQVVEEAVLEGGYFERYGRAAGPRRNESAAAALPTRLSHARTKRPDS